MKNFTQWIEEAKKKGTKDSSPPTATSSPVRGQNQDQSGYNGKNSVADYTISDEKINELSPELVGKVNKARAVGGKPSKTVAASMTLSNAVRKAFLKTRKVEEAAMVSTAGATRSAPTNMKTTGKSPASMQKAADARRMQQDRMAQQQKDEQQKDREREQAQRQAQSVARSNDKMRAKTNNMSDMSEGRKSTQPASDENPGSEHVIMQLRKVVSSRGIHPVTHVSGEKSEVNVKDAHKALAHHDNLKTSAEKDSYAKRLHHSASSMKDTMAGKAEKPKPKISLAGKITGTQ